MRSLERASDVNSARVMFPFQRCSMYMGFGVRVELEEVEEAGRISIESIVAEDAVLGFGEFVFVNGSG